jgi:membrane protein YdbS with pleckstrin-like domain
MPVVTCPDCGRDVSTIAAACPHCGRPSPAGVQPIAQALSQSAVPFHEETLWKGNPSWLLLIGKLFAMVVTLIAIPVAAWFFATKTPDRPNSNEIMQWGWRITAVLLLIQLIAFLLALARLRSTIYTVTNQRVMIETGMLSKNLSEIDLRYIDDTQFHQGVSDRMLGIGNVTIISSDKSMPSYVLRGLRDPRALREMIRTSAYQVSQRQLFTRAT